MSDRFYWLGFSAFSGIGPMRLKRLLVHFGSAKSVWEATGSDLAEILGGSLAEKLEKFRRNFSIEKYAAELQKKKVSFITLSDKEYPKLLAQIKNPPFVLYIRGEIKILAGPAAYSSTPVKQANSAFGLRSAAARASLSFGTERTARLGNSPALASPATGSPRSIAVVGTRRITNYGREVTEMFVHELVNAGFTIVSGLAIGVDAVAHQAAVENKGKTIAVLGCGIDCCTPAENQPLYNSIVEGGGVIVSELPLGHPPTKGSFPSRNRIIAGLSLGVLVTEGAEDSGSLITADYGLKFSRKVFAVPGPITSSLSKGPYGLIRKGAKLVTKTEDILQDLSITGTTSIKSITGERSVRGETKEEQKILKILENEPLHFDEIARRAGFESAKLGSILSLMEMKGMIKSLDNGLFAIAG